MPLPERRREIGQLRRSPQLGRGSTEHASELANRQGLRHATILASMCCRLAKLGPRVVDYGSWMNVFTAASLQLAENGFVPGALSAINSKSTVAEALETASTKGLTLFDAVRRAHGMSPDDADVCYWDWQPLREHLLAVWTTLGGIASARNGSAIQATAWSSPPERTADEVQGMLAEASAIRPDIHVLETSRRPKFGIIGANKPRGAALATLGLLSTARHTSYMQLLIEITSAVPAKTLNDDLLRHIDAVLVDTGNGSTDVRHRKISADVPRLLSRYFGEANDVEDRSWTTFAGFLHHVSDCCDHSWSDADLLHWLRERTPDKPARPRRGAVVNPEVPDKIADGSQ